MSQVFGRRKHWGSLQAVTRRRASKRCTARIRCWAPCSGAGYAKRTGMNVEASDGTIRFAVNWRSPGEQCTLNALVKYGKPYFDVPMRKAPDGGYYVEEGSEPHWARVWIAEHNVKVLNVAGNAIAGMEDTVQHYLEKVLV